MVVEASVLLFDQDSPARLLQQRLESPAALTLLSPAPALLPPLHNSFQRLDLA